MSRYLSSVELNGALPSGAYYAEIPAVKHLEKCGILPFSAPITIFVGENGTGKSTLLEAIAVAYGFCPEGGSKNFNFSTNDTHSELWKYLTLSRSDYPKDGYFLRAESLYTAASYMDKIDSEPSFDAPVNGAYGGRSLHTRSHGESILSIVQNRFFGNGLYILDEPETGLSPMRLLTLLYEIERLCRDGSQFLIATHSPMLTALPDAEVFAFSEEGIAAVDYRDTEHFRVCREFFADPERMLHYLLR